MTDDITTTELVRLISQDYEPAVPLDQLTPHPANPNQGDRGLVGELIEANGFAGAVLAQKSTGLLIDGEHRWLAAQDKGMATIPVLWLDVDDDARDRLLASLNEATRRGMNDMAKLVDLLQGLAVTPRGLAGAAFDGDDLDALIRSLQPPDLDELGRGAGEPGAEDGWPSITFRAPRPVAAAWIDRLKQDPQPPARLLASLLDLDYDWDAAP